MKTRFKIPIVLLFLLMATAAMAVIPKTMSYQGSLTDSTGAPIADGPYKMRFTIFNAPTLGTQFWQETQTGVQVTGGLFSVELGSVTPFPADLFTNTYLFLEIEVDLNGNAAFEANEKYIPRQHLTWSAFARNADLLDSLDSASFLRSDADDVCTGVITFTGHVLGGAPPQAGAVYINPTGVAPASFDCIFGVNDPTTGNFLSFNQGGVLRVKGTVDAGNDMMPLGYNRFGTGTAAFGEITDSNDLLVSDDLEVKGDAVVWNWLDCEGDVVIGGTLSWWTPQTRYYSMCGTNFVEIESGYNFSRYVNALYKNSGDTNTQMWIGQVNLPDGATVTSFTVWYYDNHADNLTVTLYRIPLGTASASPMAEVASSGTPGDGSGTDTGIAGATIDNNTYAYYVFFSFSANNTGTNLKFRYARIGYTITGP
jgi:hypothetical protein